ncbi:hypothetical protein QYF36_014895 [Acer negundo]|nr:hypothetical protein QYF36_014895 [Acer negundo]
MANQTWVNLGRTREHIFVVQGTLLSVRTQLNHRGCLFLEDVEPPIRVAVHLNALIVIVKKKVGSGQILKVLIKAFTILKVLMLSRSALIKICLIRPFKI